MPPYRLRSGLLYFLCITGLRRYASPPLRYDYTALRAQNSSGFQPDKFPFIALYLRIMQLFSIANPIRGVYVKAAR